MAITRADVKKLQKAGVSADVILALLDDEEDDNTPASADAGGQGSANPEAENPAAGAAPGGYDPILAAIDKLTGAIQASNIINMTQGGKPATVTVDDVMSKIIGANAPEGGK